MAIYCAGCRGRFITIGLSIIPTVSIRGQFRRVSLFLTLNQDSKESILSLPCDVDSDYYEINEGVSYIVIQRPTISRCFCLAIQCSLTYQGSNPSPLKHQSDILWIFMEFRKQSIIPYLSSKMSSHAQVIDCVPTLQTLLDKLAGITLSPPLLDAPSLYFDIEGVQLGRHGSIAIITLFVLSDGSVYLIDVRALGSAAFSTKNRQEYSMKSILEFPGVPKVFFDVRNDSDALFNLYGISLAGVQDLQLMALAANTEGLYPSERVPSLARCIERDLPATAELKEDWLEIKKQTSRIFDPKKGGSYDIFNQRPINPQILTYCCHDVVHLPKLWSVYASKICRPDGNGFWRHMVRKATVDRIELSQSEHYDGQAKDKVRGPWYAELVKHELEQWNDDVFMLGINDNGTLKELSFGVFRWL